MILFDIVIALLFLLLGFNLKNLYKFNNEEKTLINIIFVFHTIVCIAAIPFFDKADGYWYWMAPKSMSYNYLWRSLNLDVNPTQIQYFINFFPSNILGLSYPTGMLLYSVIGMWGIIYLLLSIKEFVGSLTFFKSIKVFGVSIYPFIFLLPNMHFWSVAIGKDTLLFFSISLFIYSILKFKSRILGLIISIIIAYFLRPHILLFLVSGFALAYILSRRFPLYQKILFTTILTIAFLPLLNVVLEFAKIDQFSTEHLEDFATKKSKALSVAGSGVDLSSYPYPLKVLTFLFRPLFFDVNGIPAVIASVENLVQIFLLFFFFKNRGLYFIARSHYVIRGCFFYYLIGAFAFAPVMSNLGIIIREKNMLMPAFLLFVLGSIQFKRMYKYGK